MPKYQALSRDLHRSVRLAPLQSLRFAAKTTLVPLYAAELAFTIKSFPIVFTKVDEHYALVGMLGLAQDENRFVDQNGRWNGDYIPAAFRRGPFVVGKNEQGQLVIAIDMEHEQVSSEQGEALFDQAGEATVYLQSIITFLENLESSRVVTEHAVAALVEADLLVPRNIEWLEPNGEKRTVAGVFMVDENKLNTLSDEAFLALRQAGAVPVIYAHLLSLGNLQRLQELGKAKDSFDFSNLEQGGLLSFRGL